jgi:alkylation response protein AidB-like acyl-CoA dehydrogenase
VTTATVDPIGAARALAPTIQALAPEIEANRRLPLHLVDEMRAAGLFSLVLPHDLGGDEVDPVTAARVVEEVSAADGSAGWCVMIAAQNQAFAGLMAPDEARVVWANRAIVCGTARPIGRAVVSENGGGGYVVSGRWPFASGSSHADWFAAECVVYEGDEPRRDSAGNEVTRMVAIPRAEVTVHETWDTSGLRGTASNDFSCEAAFVPEGRGFQMLVTPPSHAWPLYRTEPLYFINHGSQSLGVARAAISAAIELANTKDGWGGVKMREIPRVQSVIAEATALYLAASRFLYDSAEELWAAAVAGRGDDAQLRARVRLATSHASRASVQAVDLVYFAAGTSAIFKQSPLERQFRDIHTAAAHVMVGQMTYEAAGRVELGLDPQFPFF